MSDTHTSVIIDQREMLAGEFEIIASPVNVRDTQQIVSPEVFFSRPKRLFRKAMQNASMLVLAACFCVHLDLTLGSLTSPIQQTDLCPHVTADK